MVEPDIQSLMVKTLCGVLAILYRRSGELASEVLKKYIQDHLIAVLEGRGFQPNFLISNSGRDKGFGKGVHVQKTGYTSFFPLPFTMKPA